MEIFVLPMRYKGCHQAHNAQVVICVLFTTRNSLKLQGRLALVASALFLAAAMTATGLDKRIALVILSRVGGEAHHVVMGAILVGFVMAFLVPSTTARVACLVPITLGIISAFGVNKKGAFAGMLMITTVQTASIWNVGIKTAAAQNMVSPSLIPS